MAKINTTGLEEIEKMFVSQSETVEKAADAMLNAGADVLVEYQKTEAARLKRSGRSMGGLEKSIKKTKIKASATERSIEVYPHGTDKNHTKKGVPNAEKGFVLEYGRSDTPPDPWVSLANEKAEDPVSDTMAKAWDNHG